MKKLILPLFTLLLISSCASLSGFEEGRSLGEGVGEIGASLNYINLPQYGLEDVSSKFRFPVAEFGYKYGISDKMDLGGYVSTTGNIGALIKYQFIGDKESKFAMASGIGISTAIGTVNTFSIPLYTSFHPSEKLSINIAPKYLFQFVTTDISYNVHYIGGNFGVLFGDKHKFGIDIGVFNGFTNYDVSSGAILLNIGIGGRFRLN